MIYAHHRSLIDWRMILIGPAKNIPVYTWIPVTQTFQNNKNNFPTNMKSWFRWCKHVCAKYLLYYSYFAFILIPTAADQNNGVHVMFLYLTIRFSDSWRQPEWHKPLGNRFRNPWPLFGSSRPHTAVVQYALYYVFLYCMYSKSTYVQKSASL